MERKIMYMVSYWKDNSASHCGSSVHQTCLEEAVATAGMLAKLLDCVPVPEKQTDTVPFFAERVVPWTARNRPNKDISLRIGPLPRSSSLYACWYGVKVETVEVYSR